MQAPTASHPGGTGGTTYFWKLPQKVNGDEPGLNPRPCVSEPELLTRWSPTLGLTNLVIQQMVRWIHMLMWQLLQTRVGPKKNPERCA